MQSNSQLSKEGETTRGGLLGEEEEVFPLSAPKGRILLRAEVGYQLQSGLIAGYREEYPQGGWVVSSSAEKEEIREGDYVVVEVDAFDVAPTYYQVFEIVTEGLEGLVSILCEPDLEPIIVEAVEKARATGEDSRITLRDLMGEGWQMSTKDILTYQWAHSNSPGFSLLYPKGIRMFYYEGKLYYNVAEESILCIIEEW